MKKRAGLLPTLDDGGNAVEDVIVYLAVNGTLAAGQPGRAAFTMTLEPERKLPRMQRYENPQG